MKQNMGSTDRLLRIVLGLVIGILGVLYDNWWGLIGLVPILTGLFKWCPFYKLFNITTIEK